MRWHPHGCLRKRMKRRKVQLFPLMIAAIALAASPLLALGQTALAAGGTIADAAPAYYSFAPTPPMGWNSYDAFGDSVTEDEVMANAAYVKEKLLPHGWNYMVIDFRWYDPQPTGDDHALN